MKEYKREISINDLLFEEGDEVKLPLNQKGIIKSVSNIPWGFNVSVEITEGSFNEVGDIVEYRKQDLELDE